MKTFPLRRIYEHAVDAWLNAVKSVDNGIEPKDVDACYVGNYSADLFNHQGHLGPMISSLFGLNPKPAPRFEGACASSGVAFRQAIITIASGLMDVICVCGIEVMNEEPTSVFMRKGKQLKL